MGAMTRVGFLLRRLFFGLATWGAACVVQATSLSERTLLQAQVGAIMAEASHDDDPAHGNHALSIENGYDALLLRVHLIREARRSIDLQTFIWTNDECGRLLIHELVEAARRGVRVRIIADHMVSDQNPEVGAFLSTVSPHFEVRHYRPVMQRLKPSWWRQITSGLWGFRDLNQRMHNKLMVVDGTVMITGGRNIENTYFNHSTGMNFRDRGVLIVGPVVAEAEASFEQYWHYRHSVPTAQLKDVARVMARGDFARYAARTDYDFGEYFDELDGLVDDPAAMRARFWQQLQPVRRVEFVGDRPGKGKGMFDRQSPTTRALHRLVKQARREVTVQSPYLILSDSARRLAREVKAAHPGMALRVSTNSYASTDNIIAYSANYRLRGRYVEDLGLRVFEFKPRPEVMADLFPEFAQRSAEAEQTGSSETPFFCLHAKSLVIDERLSFVGSYNLDPRSVSLNTEVGVIIEDVAFARELRRQIERDMAPANSWVVAKRESPLGLNAVNGLIDDLLSIGPIDPWPFQNTSSFELRAGQEEVGPDVPEFYDRYRDVGDFPGAESGLSRKDILTRIYKMVGKTLTPIM